MDSMMKMMPHFTSDFVDNIPYAFQMTPDDILTQEDFEMLFDMKAKMSKNYGVQKSALKKKNEI